MGKKKNRSSGKDKLGANEQQLKAAIQQLRASEQQLKAANQQLDASNQQLRANEQQLRAEITERKQAEEALRETRNYLEKLINYANAPIIVWDPKFRVTKFNRASERLTGYATDEVIGQELNMLFPKANRKESRSKIEHALQGEYWESVEIPILCKSGEIRLAVWNSATIYAKDGTTLLAVIAQGQDITERKRAEESLQATNQQLRTSEQQLKSLASQLTLTEEHERHQIATDLHATIGQSLVISKIKLDALRASAASKDLARTLGEICNLLDQTIQETKTLTFDLSSPILYELGFEVAVGEWLTERIQKKHRIATEFEDDEQPKPLDYDVRTLLFRDVRELLFNVVKHAQAKKVKVSICKVGGEIHVGVEDDGWGFDPDEIKATAVRKGGFGLFSIRERLEQLGGHLEIESAPGQGTKATLIAPLKREKVDDGRKK